MGETSEISEVSWVTPRIFIPNKNEFKRFKRRRKCDTENFHDILMDYCSQYKVLNKITKYDQQT